MAKKPPTRSSSPSEDEARSTNAVDRHLGKRLRKLRLDHDVSQEELAERLGITFQQVQKYEKAVNRIAASRLFDIAHALNVPIGKFFEGLTLPGGEAADEVEDRARQAKARQIIDHAAHIVTLATELSE